MAEDEAAVTTDQSVVCSVLTPPSSTGPVCWVPQQEGILKKMPSTTFTNGYAKIFILMCRETNSTKLASAETKYLVPSQRSQLHIPDRACGSGFWSVIIPLIMLTV